LPGIHIDRFIAGLHTNRAAISTPFRSSFGHVIEYRDALIDGLNVEISPANTLVRRPGWSSYNTVGYLGTAQSFGSAILNNGNSGTAQFNLLGTSSRVYNFTNSALTSLYTKTTTNQTFFKTVGNLIYFSDGVSNYKWSGATDIAGTLAAIANAGIATPTTGPTIPNLNLYDTVGATQTTHAWVASYTYKNTTSSPQAYFFLAPTGEIQWTVIPKGTTLTSASSSPNWATNYGLFGGVTVDGQLSWTNCGPIGTWLSSTAFKNAAYIATHPLSTTATTATIAGSGGATNFAWQISSGPQNPWGTAAGFANSAGLTGNTNNLDITGLGFNVPAGATITGIEVDVFRGTNRYNAVTDVTVQLMKASSPVGSNRAVSGYWPAILVGQPASVFYEVPGSGGIKQQYGSGGDLWGTTWAPTDVNSSTFGVRIVANQANTATTTGGITYVGGDPQTPVIVKVYYKAAASDLGSANYAQIILDSNGNLQRVKTAGTSGGSAPSWSTTIGGTTTDGGVTWECLGTGNQLAPLFNWTYAFGYHSSYGTNHISTMSPQLVVQAPIIGNGVNLTGACSTDTQVDRDDVYRSTDGGPILLYATSATNVSGSSWSLTDVALDSDLNTGLIGPVAHANDAPPTGATILEYHMGRMWAAVGNLLYFSAGPDCTNGDGNQAWPPANVFTLAGPITGLASTTNGLVVLTSIDMSVVLGGPQTLTFWVQPLLKNFGIQSPNCLAHDGDQLIIYTTQKQMFTVTATGRNEIGFTVSPTLANTFSTTGSYLAVHRAGQDQGIFISDAAANLLRLNMNSESWDAVQQPVMGAGPIASLDLTTGSHGLLMAVGGNILLRNPSVFADAGAAYSAYATIGSIVLSQGGEKAAKVKSIILQSAAVGTQLVVGVLPNEVTGSFTTIPPSNADPWQLPATSTITMQEFQWLGAQSMIADILRHMQIKITMPSSDTVKNEVFAVSIT
jgi:hypothetical protein